MRVDMADRSACDDPIKRDPKLDTAAQRLAEDSGDKPMFSTRSKWQFATAYELDAAMKIMAPFITDNVSTCSWRAYGVGLVGAPGANHRLVLLLVE